MPERRAPAARAPSVRAPSLPSMPRTPKPPGTSTASTPPSAFWAPASVWHSSLAHPADAHLGVVVEAAGAHRLGDREVGVGQVDVLADQGDLDVVLGVVHPAQQLVPVGPVDVAERQAQAADDVGVEALAVQHLGDVVDARRVDALATASMSTSHISEILRLTPSGMSRSARSTMRVGLDADLAQRGDRVLGRLGLQLAARARGRAPARRAGRRRCRGRRRGAPGGRPRGTAATRCRRRCRRSR